MINQFVIEKSQGFADSTKTDGHQCTTGMVKESSQDEEASSKLSSSWVTNGSEVRSQSAYPI
jgi:hypothetical protein